MGCRTVSRLANGSLLAGQGLRSPPAGSEAHIRIAMIDNLLKRVAGETTQTWRGTYYTINGEST